MQKKTCKILAKGRRRDEIPGHTDTQFPPSVSTVIRVMKSPFHEGGKGHAVTMVLKSLLQPRWAGHIKGLHVVRMACTRTESWVFKQ